MRRLLLYWGVHPLLCDLADNSDMMQNNALAAFYLLLAGGDEKKADDLLAKAGADAAKEVRGAFTGK